MTTVGESVTRVRNILKAVKEDAFVTDRQIYFNLVKYGKALLKREDNQNKLMRIPSLMTVLPYVELIDSDKIEAECFGVYSGCYFKRTKEKLPQFFEGSYGPLIRSVTSIDGSRDLIQTDPSIYVKISKSTNFKYNKNIYFWYLNGYLYIANVDWDAIRVEGVFEGATGDFLCDPEERCKSKQERQLPFPEYLFGEIEQYTIKDLTMTLQIPDTGADDSQNPHR
jgi:hypothetical protein